MLLERERGDDPSQTGQGSHTSLSCWMEEKGAAAVRSASAGDSFHFFSLRRLHPNFFFHQGGWWRRGYTAKLIPPTRQIYRIQCNNNSPYSPRFFLDLELLLLLLSSQTFFGVLFLFVHSIARPFELIYISTGYISREYPLLFFLVAFWPTSKLNRQCQTVYSWFSISFLNFK
jgi:hypothetical protein